MNIIVNGGKISKMTGATSYMELEIPIPIYKY
ncbi:hypothetical protein NC652_027883 [Populus alba x Populus x berolinensis]|uniref:Uncharacterized protein n=1 Tax=Populus alba x Populus x berolinensis TaxID=444605 RepID=A0AAD6M615_9ROSI|nr:hypothetical protein NC651_027030 [Populus alba x Populus x berolinensis]KAJ6893939.1 hypothetical protein NC652_027883 [Populus alba x Populus x berolinensis]KAJ6979540.1 hypothetical protein NC653_027631 [Populus alba x Populus x berolinensis]KAJ6979548.1 hypothetical protein NC653_027637 [Populus alba x Populus x berolinensis]KAJ6980618.1 hypothetical protein NC653_028428 [Populus alba x Populus x berolinensis]